MLEYQIKYPKKIEVFLREKNYGMMANLVEVFKACKGEYIAWCEGDDYWTDSRKLQKQIDFLDNNPQYSISSHDVAVLDDNTGIISGSWKKEWAKKNGEVNIEDIIRYGGAATCSLIWRNKVFGDFPGWYSEQKGGDWSLQVLCTSIGPMKYFFEKMGVYRLHDHASHYARIKEAKNNGINIAAYLYDNMEQMINALDRHFNKKYTKLLGAVRGQNHLRTFCEYFKMGDIENSRKHACDVLPILFSLPPLIVLKTITKLIIIYFPQKMSKFVIKRMK